EDGIRDFHVTGVQTCALPIYIFHTNAQRIVDYLSRFTEWRPYEHRVLARVDGHLVPIPINLTTLNTLFGLSMSEEEAEAFLAARSEERRVGKEGESAGAPDQ